MWSWGRIRGGRRRSHVQFRCLTPYGGSGEACPGIPARVRVPFTALGPLPVRVGLEASGPNSSRQNTASGSPSSGMTPRRRSLRGVRRWPSWGHSPGRRRSYRSLWRSWPGGVLTTSYCPQPRPRCTGWFRWGGAGAFAGGVRAEGGPALGTSYGVGVMSRWCRLPGPCRRAGSRPRPSSGRGCRCCSRRGLRR